MPRLVVLGDKYFTFLVAQEKIPVHVEALHAKSPRGEFRTEELVHQLATNTCCAGIIANLSRDVIDFNRAPKTEEAKRAKTKLYGYIRDNLKYSQVFKKLVLTSKYLRLSLHGMLDRDYAQIELGSLRGELASTETLDWAKNFFKKNTEWKVVFDQLFTGDLSLKKTKKLFGPNFETLQVEINNDLLNNHFEELVSLFTKFILSYPNYDL